MKILAIDYGEKRVGLALGDTDLNLALPHGVLNQKSDEVLVEQLLQIVDEEGVDTVVVGDPLAATGGKTEQTNTSRAFAALLRTRLKVPVELFDERFTSQRADAAPRELKTRSRDEMAAMFLLQDYLDRQTITHP